MGNQGNNRQVKGAVALKAGIWYTLCTVLQKGIAFFTMPIFTRIMSKSDVGLFNTYATWISLFVMITTFDLPLSIIRSKHEFEGDENSYTFSILTLTTLTNAIFMGVCLLFKEWIFGSVLEMRDSFILPMFLYLFLSPAIEMFATKQRAYYKYKTYVVTTIISTIASTLIALVLVLGWSDKLSGRFLGQYVTIAAVGAVFYVIIAVQGKKVKLKYWKDSFLMCFPLLLHLLSLYILGSSNKIMITKFKGEEYTALYSVANSAIHIASLLMQSMNRSWAPWMLDMLQYGEKEKLSKAAKPYILFYFGLATCCMLFAPEIILILGGRSYMDAVNLMPPLLTGTIFTFVYQMYLQTEFFEKKTKVVGVATIGAALINICLNLLLIPRFGYLAAGYTTLVGYIFMFVFHYFYACKLGYGKIFDRRFVFVILTASFVVMGMNMILYRMTIVRYIVILAMAILMGCMAMKYKNVILDKLGRKKPASV